jgi:TetR/AcrR family transcriptional repressor of nem operon
MRDPERTREHIVRQAAGLFNRRGFAGASLADIMAATGLQKGGIYGHFRSKEELALEAFDFAVRQMGDRFAAVLEGKPNAIDRLRAIAGAFAEIPENPPVPGGCPMMNAGVENDDGNPAIRDRARTAMEGLRTLIRQTVRKGIARGEVRPDVDGDRVATVMVATLEGGVMLSQLYGDPRHARVAAEHVGEYLDGSVRG